MLKGLRKFSSFSQPTRGANLRPKVVARRSLSPDGASDGHIANKALMDGILGEEDEEASMAVKKVIALHDYEPVNPDTDLGLARGAEYDIIDSTGVWWMARDPDTNQIGLIPFNYVQVICDDIDDEPPVLVAKHSPNIDKLSSTSSSSASSSASNSITSDNDSTGIHSSRTFHPPSSHTNSSISHSQKSSDPWALETSQFTVKNSWYQPTVDREKAERILYNCNRNGAFLIRPSTSEARCFTLSLLVKSEKLCGVKHYLIQQCPTSGRFHIRTTEQFESLDRLIKHYRVDKGHLPTVLTTIPGQNAMNNASNNNNIRSNINNNSSNGSNSYNGKLDSGSKNGGGVQRSRILSNSHSSSHSTSHITLGSKDKSWEIKASELQLLEELGSGQFGVVRHGKWRSRTDVAVKLMKEGTMSEEDFIDEAKVMTRLQHPNLVKLYGLCIEHRPICIVAEYLKHGSLLSFLRKNDAKLNSSTTPSSTVALILLNMSSQICSAMAYLEGRNYIHRDLAARNCLVGNGGVVKVADFGLTRYVIDDEYTSSGGTKFPIRWAPPEVLWYTRFSSKSDVWAFGILLWEIYSCGRLPYGKLSNAEVVDQIRQGARLERPSNLNCSADVYQLMHICWEETPEQRPSFQRIVTYLSSLRSKEIAKKH